LPDKLTPNSRELYASHIPARITLMKLGRDHHPSVRVVEWCSESACKLLRLPGRKIEMRRFRATTASGADIRGIKTRQTNDLHRHRRLIPSRAKFDNTPLVAYSSNHDSPLAGSFDWLLLGAGKPPSGRFSHFRVPDFSMGLVIESPRARRRVLGLHLLHIACLRWSQGRQYAIANRATALSALSEGIAQPWWLFCARCQTPAGAASLMLKVCTKPPRSFADASDAACHVFAGKRTGE